MKMIFETHPVANIFPLMGESEFQSLKDDIRVHGLREPIWLHAGQVIDGRHRLRACQEIGIEPRIEIYDGDDVVAFVISLNLHRRHLNESQRAMVASKISNIKFGDFVGNQHVPAANLQAAHDDEKRGASIEAPLPETDKTLVSQDKAAELLNVSRSSVQRATRVKEEGVPELTEAVYAGHVSISAASAIAAIPQEEQRKIVEQVERGETTFSEAAKTVRTSREPASKYVEKPEEQTVPLSQYQALQERLDEISRNLEEAIADNESMGRVFDSNDQLTAAVGEAKRYREQNRVLEERLRGLMNEKNAAIRSAKSYQSKCAKLEKELKMLQSIDPAAGF